MHDAAQFRDGRIAFVRIMTIRMVGHAIDQVKLLLLLGDGENVPDEFDVHSSG